MSTSFYKKVRTETFAIASGWRTESSSYVMVVSFFSNNTEVGTPEGSRH
jgi:hypothetical protein